MLLVQPLIWILPFIVFTGKTTEIAGAKDGVTEGVAFRAVLENINIFWLKLKRTPSSGQLEEVQLT